MQGVTICPTTSGAQNLQRLLEATLDFSYPRDWGGGGGELKTLVLKSNFKRNPGLLILIMTHSLELQFSIGELDVLFDNMWVNLFRTVIVAN